MAKLNFSQLKEKAAEGNTFPTLDHGNYELEVMEAELNESKAGNPKIQVRLKEVESGITMIEHLTLTEKAIFNFFNFIENAGINPPEGEVDLGSEEFDDFVHSFIGERVTAEVEVQEYLNDEEKKKPKKDQKPFISNGIKNYIDKSKVGKGNTRKRRTL